MNTCSAQESVEYAYMQRVDSIVASPSAEIYTLPQKANLQKKTTAFYRNGELLCIRTVRIGELASCVETNYYILECSLIATTTKKCLTRSEILDLELYVEAYTDSLGKTDLSYLPTDCMTISVLHNSKETVRIIEGTDVFDPMCAFKELQQSDQEHFNELLKELGNIR